MGESKAWRDLMAVPDQRIGETRANLLQLRAALETLADKVDGAEKLQQEAMKSYKQEAYALALRTQLTALWLLAPGDPALPRSLAEPATPALAALQAVASEPASAAMEEGSKPGAKAPCTVQAALLLEVAATTLHLGEWPMARYACEAVLDRGGAADADTATILLAQAHDGAGAPRRALAALGTLLEQQPGHEQASGLQARIRARLDAEKRMYGGLFERAQRTGRGQRKEEAGLYSEAALQQEARQRQAERDAQLTPENIAKLPADRWTEIVSGLGPEQMQRCFEQNAELAKQLPDGAWQKHAAAFSPENIELARQAMELHRAGVRPGQAAADRDGGGEGGGEEDWDEFDEEETWVDRMLTRVDLATLAALAVAWATAWAMGLTVPPPETSPPLQDL